MNSSTDSPPKPDMEWQAAGFRDVMTIPKQCILDRYTIDHGGS